MHPFLGVSWYQTYIISDFKHKEITHNLHKRYFILRCNTTSPCMYWLDRSNIAVFWWYYPCRHFISNLKGVVGCVSLLLACHGLIHHMVMCYLPSCYRGEKCLWKDEMWCISEWIDNVGPRSECPIYFDIRWHI